MLGLFAPEPRHRPIAASREDPNTTWAEIYTPPANGFVDPSVYSTAPDAHPIAGQALEIIFSILEDPSPGLAEVQLRLRRCMAAHPGRPERALLAHLLDTSLRVNANDGNGCPGL